MQDSHEFNCNVKSQEANREVARLSASLCGGCMVDYYGFVNSVMASSYTYMVTRHKLSISHQLDENPRWKLIDSAHFTRAYETT